MNFPLVLLYALQCIHTLRKGLHFQEEGVSMATAKSASSSNIYQFHILLLGVGPTTFGDHSRTRTNRLLGTNDMHLPFE
jgi:hypothetical protein